MNRTIFRCAHRFCMMVVICLTLTACGGSSNSLDQSDNDTDSSPEALAQPVTCTTPNADDDGDGWGWENEQSCKIADSQVTTTDELPVGIVYYVWHCITKTSVYQDMYRRAGLPSGEEFNTTNVLTGKQRDWGDENRFHWWDEPQEGYYCLGDEPEIIRTHLAMLRDAGIDFLVIDITNHPNTKSLVAEEFILKSLRPLLDAAKSIENAPKIVPWLPLAAENADTQSERDNVCLASPNSNRCKELRTAPNVSMLEHVTTLLLEEYPDQLYTYKDKPLLLEAANDALYPRALTDTVRPQVEQNWTVRRTWGLQKHTEDWQFLSTCADPVDFYNSQGWTERGCNQAINANNEQISVTAAYQYTYISEPFQQDARNANLYTGGMPKFYGRTLAQQFRVAFEKRNLKPLVLVTGWNEWIASRFKFDGRDAFVDAYNHEKNRDIEPGGSSSDYYYFLLRRLIALYRAGDPFAFSDYFLTRESILDPDYYWSNNQDLQGAFQQSDTAGLLNHWLTTGIGEGRRPSLLFDATFYAQNYGDLATAGVTTANALLQHFLDAGFLEGRQGAAEFLAPAYINRYNKLRTLFGEHGYYQAYRYYLRSGQYAPDNHKTSP